MLRLVTSTYICCAVSFKGIAGRHQDQSNCQENLHQKETFSTTPHVHHFRHGEVKRGGARISQCSRNRRQGMGTELTCHVGIETCIGCRDECVHEIQEPNTIRQSGLVSENFDAGAHVHAGRSWGHNILDEYRNQGPFRPGNSHSFHILHTMLRI